MIGLSTLCRLYIQKGDKVPLFNQATLFMMNQELLYKYFKGTASIEEEKQILDWVEASEENREAYLKERMLFDVSLFSTKQDNKKKTIRFMPTLRWAARIAAAVIIAVSGYYMTTNYIYNKDAQPQTITVPAGQRAQITLADGTRVWLNAQSTLTYASDFGRNDRNVELDGEAYFDSIRPFSCIYADHYSHMPYDPSKKGQVIVTSSCYIMNDFFKERGFSYVQSYDFQSVISENANFMTIYKNNAK